jgi:hypothetical protein
MDEPISPGSASTAILISAPGSNRNAPAFALTRAVDA